MTQPNPRASWKRSLAIVWIGEFFSVLTSSILQMGLIWHVTLTTGSASALSFVSLAAFLPMALLGAFAGTIVDRTSIKRLMIGADLFIAAVSLTLVFGSLRGDLSVAVVAAVLFVRALGSTLHAPAFNALTPLIAPPEALGKLAGMLQFMQSGSYIIGNAIAAVVYPVFGAPAFNALTPLIAPPEALGKLAGMLQFMQSGSYIIGNAIAAVVYPVFGLTFMIALDVAGAVLASIAVATSGIKTPAPERHTPEENAEASHHAVRAFLLETADGCRELKRHHGLFAMLWIGFAFSVLFSPISALFPLMVFDHFGGTTTQSAIAEIAFSVRHALDRFRLLGPVLAHIRAVPAHGLRSFWGHHYAVGQRGDRVLGRHDRGERLARGRSSSVRRAIAMPPLGDARPLTLWASHRSGSVSCS